MCFGDSSSANCSKMAASADKSTSSVKLSSSVRWLLRSACVVLARRFLGGGVCVPVGACLCCCLAVLLICVGLFGGIAFTGVRCVAFVVWFVCLFCCLVVCSVCLQVLA